MVISDENDAEPLPAVNVKVEAMSANATDDDCYVVENQGNFSLWIDSKSDLIQLNFLFIVDLEIGEKVAKHENIDNEPNVQIDGAGHGKNGLGSI